MALDINGYNATFKSFVDFAQQRVNANDAKAVAEAQIQTPLGGRKIVAVTQTMTADLAVPGSNMQQKISFGQVTFSQRLVIDLTAEIPTVTDFKISQNIA